MARRKIDIDKIKLTREERSIEAAIERGEYRPASPEIEQRIREMLRARRKDKVLNIRINGDDLKRLKAKAKKLGVPYQSFVAELIHEYVA